MCGIAGYFGKPCNPELSREIITGLFYEIETRGKDASGFWCSSTDSVFYHKEPVKSSEIVKRKVWKNAINRDPFILICHARDASLGVGLPSKNENNHPFVNEDCSVAAIHNGRIPDSIYLPLKEKYSTISNCDSELFLSMFIGDIEINHSLQDRINTLREMWSALEGSHMAVAIAELHPRRLWLFRNDFRTLYKSEINNQIFFFSTEDIWRKATRKLAADTTIEEIEADKIFCFTARNGVTHRSIFNF